MKTKVGCVAVCAVGLCAAQTLSPHWEELTSADFEKALAEAQGVCILAGGIMEKHGPSGPLGTDMFNARYGVELAVKKAYAIVFPEYYVGQIVEAQQQPGTISYSTETQLVQRPSAELPYADYHRDMSGPLKEELPRRLPWLFDELGFQTTFHDYSYKAMGSSVVELESNSLRVRFKNDRGSISIDVASLSEPSGGWNWASSGLP
jgi:hypothetical protein